MTPAKGKLYLVPAPLDFACDKLAPLRHVLPQATLDIAARLQHWICENAKSARAYLVRVRELQPLALPIQALDIQELPHQVHKKGDHQVDFDARPLLGPALRGQDIGLVSEAGMPAVADPGSSVVCAAHDLGVTVVPLVGPSSLLLALAASGLSGQNFAFVGYLPAQTAQRTQRIRELESLALQTGQTQLFIETPYRNEAMLQSLLEVLDAQTRLAVAGGLTLEDALLRSDKVASWKSRRTSLDKNMPVVFAIGR